MKKMATLLFVGILLLGFNFLWAAGDFSQVEELLGAKGQMQEGALVVRFPRNDLKIRIKGEAVPIALGFGSWAAFHDLGQKTMVMGDLVLLPEEVNPVISALEENGLEISALHNHFFYENPRIMFMHISGLGPREKLAQGLRRALDQTGMGKAAPAAAAEAGPAPAPLTLDTKRLEQIIGHPGQAGGEVFKITVGRQGFKMQAMTITSSMGLNSWAGFMGSNEQAHVAGDIVMTAAEVNSVIKALRAGGIEVVALHNHMLSEQPRAFFLHYWGIGPAEKLAQTVRTTFDLVKAPAR